MENTISLILTIVIIISCLALIPIHLLLDYRERRMEEKEERRERLMKVGFVKPYGIDNHVQSFSSFDKAKWETLWVYHYNEEVWYQMGHLALRGVCRVVDGTIEYTHPMLVKTLDHKYVLDSDSTWVRGQPLMRSRPRVNTPHRWGGTWI